MSKENIWYWPGILSSLRKMPAVLYSQTRVWYWTTIQNENYGWGHGTSRARVSFTNHMLYCIEEVCMNEFGESWLKFKGSVVILTRDIVLSLWRIDSREMSIVLRVTDKIFWPAEWLCKVIAVVARASKSRVSLTHQYDILKGRGLHECIRW